MGTSAVQHLFDQYRVARRADRLAKQVLRAVRHDPVLLDWGVKMLPSSAPIVHEEIDGPDVFFISPGGTIDRSRAVTKTVQAPVDWVGFHVEEITGKLRDRETWAKMAESASNRTVRAIRNRALKAYAAAVPDLELIENDGGAVKVDGQPLIGALGVDIRARCQLGVWLDEAETAAWVNHDSPYFSVLMRIPFGGIIHAEPVVERLAP